MRLVSQDAGRARAVGFWYAQGMNDIAETRRLAEAINSLASVIAEIIAERVKHLEEASERKIKELPALAADPVLTKRELAARLRIGARTVDTWMKGRRLPYIKIGKAVRFRWSEVERCLEMLEKRPGWCVLRRGSGSFRARCRR